MLKQIINKLITLKKVNTKKEGTVKFFNNSKGFGFIKVHDSDQEIFVHVSNLIDDIREDDKVKFDVDKDEKGPYAIKVSLS